LVYELCSLPTGNKKNYNILVFIIKNLDLDQEPNPNIHSCKGYQPIRANKVILKPKSQNRLKPKKPVKAVLGYQSSDHLPSEMSTLVSGIGQQSSVKSNSNPKVKIG